MWCHVAFFETAININCCMTAISIDLCTSVVTSSLFTFTHWNMPRDETHSFHCVWTGVHIPGVVTKEDIDSNLITMRIAWSFVWCCWTAMIIRLGRHKDIRKDMWPTTSTNPYEVNNFFTTKVPLPKRNLNASNNQYSFLIQYHFTNIWSVMYFIFLGIAEYRQDIQFLTFPFHLFKKQLTINYVYS